MSCRQAAGSMFLIHPQALMCETVEKRFFLPVQSFFMIMVLNAQLCSCRKRTNPPSTCSSYVQTLFSLHMKNFIPLKLFFLHPVMSYLLPEVKTGFRVLFHLVYRQNRFHGSCFALV